MRNYKTDPYYNFTPEALIEQFASQYEYEYGRKKVLEIVNKVQNSEKISQYLMDLLINRINPSPKGLEMIMNTMNYFMFSKEETLCLGGLFCFIQWRNSFFSINDFSLEETEEIDLEKFTPICAQFIRICERNKYNKSDNFFLRFERKINQVLRGY